MTASLSVKMKHFNTLLTDLNDSWSWLSNWINNFWGIIFDEMLLYMKVVFACII